MPIHPQAAAYVFPVIGGFVGGDTVAGILATRLAEQDGPVLMVDIGTNGEIVLAHRRASCGRPRRPPGRRSRARGFPAACGRPPGPSRRSCSTATCTCSVIGNAPPIGLCGSGLIDLAAELLRPASSRPRAGCCRPRSCPPPLPAALRAPRDADGDGQPEFLLAGRRTRAAGNRLTLTQRDIRELQLATGAIRAGINILLKQAGLTTADLKRVLIAGGFGSFIRRYNAQRIGLLPPDVDHEQIVYVGNASLDGAKWALLSTQARTARSRGARPPGALHVELSQDADFQMEFAEAMIFPEG